MRSQVLKALGALAVAMLVAGVALAQEPPAAPPGEGPATREGRPGHEGRGARMMDRLVQDLGVTGETETTVRTLFDEFRDATRTWQRENGGKLRELHEQLYKAREAGDEAKQTELNEQIAKLQQDRLVPRDTLLAELAEVLTAEQMEKVKDVVIEWRAMLRWVTRDMSLTDAQKAKLDEIIKTYDEAAATQPTPGRRGFAQMRALFEKVVTEVILTDAQREALAADTSEEGFFDKVAKLDLTDAQKGQIARFQGPPRGRRFRGGPGSRPAGPREGPPPGEGPGGPPPEEAAPQE